MIEETTQWIPKFPTLSDEQLEKLKKRWHKKKKAGDRCLNFYRAGGWDSISNIIFERSDIGRNLIVKKFRKFINSGDLVVKNQRARDLRILARKLTKLFFEVCKEALFSPLNGSKTLDIPMVGKWYIYQLNNVKLRTHVRGKQYIKDGFAPKYLVFHAELDATKYDSEVRLEREMVRKLCFLSRNSDFCAPSPLTPFEKDENGILKIYPHSSCPR
jgi:hypothetical protein